MKSKILGLMVGFLLIGFNLFAADGDLIVNGNVGIGTTSPNTKMQVTTSSGSINAARFTTNDYSTSGNTGTDFGIQFGASSGNTYTTLSSLTGGGDYWGNLILQYGGGNVGIGTTGPGYKLDVAGTGIVARMGALIGHTTASHPAGAGHILITGPTGTYTFLGAQTNDNVMVLTGSGNVGIGTTSPSYPLHMGSGAHVTTGGVWTDASSIEYKENIKDLTTEDAIETLERLNPVRYNYKMDKEDKHVGFIAEDVPELIATRDRKGLSPMDIVAVLTKVVQEQRKTISELSEKVDSLEKERNKVK